MLYRHSCIKISPFSLNKLDTNLFANFIKRGGGETFKHLIYHKLGVPVEATYNYRVFPFSTANQIHQPTFCKFFSCGERKKTCCFLRLCPPTICWPGWILILMILICGQLIWIPFMDNFSQNKTSHCHVASNLCAKPTLMWSLFQSWLCNPASHLTLILKLCFFYRLR